MSNKCVMFTVPEIYMLYFKYEEDIRHMEVLGGFRRFHYEIAVSVL